MPLEKKTITADEVKKIQLGILDEVNSFCIKNSITFFLSYGTLLGAVRHRGYIPWDDDIDIMMLRDDYNRFINSFNINRDDCFKVSAFEIEPAFPYLFAKVINTNTILIERTGIDYPIGINIDVFPFDNMPGKEEADSTLRRMLPVLKVLQVKQIADRKRSLVKTVGLKILKTGCKLFPVESCLKYLNSCVQSYAGMTTEYVAFIPDYMFIHEYTLLRRDWLKDSVLVEFEGREFPAPADFDHVLNALYGDYMKLPPEEERCPHHNFSVYWK